MQSSRDVSADLLVLSSVFAIGRISTGANLQGTAVLTNFPPLQECIVLDPIWLRNG